MVVVLPTTVGVPTAAAVVVAAEVVLDTITVAIETETEMTAIRIIIINNNTIITTNIITTTVLVVVVETSGATNDPDLPARDLRKHRQTSRHHPVRARRRRPVCKDIRLIAM